jgi:transposase
MHGFRLTEAQRRQLRSLLASEPRARRYRRALALLALDEGRSVTEVAGLVGVSRQAVHNWLAAYRLAPGATALDDGYGPGRPPLWTEALRALLRAALRQRPHHLGYLAANWTVPLLREHLHRQADARLSDDTIRRQLDRLGYVWKRYRYVLPPDPERDKKTAPPPPHPGLAPAVEPPGSAGRGRDRPAPVPAAAGGLGGAG